MPLKSLGVRIKYCPDCNEELFESTRELDDDGNDSIRTKECPMCGKIFKKKKGTWRRWRMGTFEEHLEDELNRM